MSDLEKINSIFNAKIDSVKTKEELQNIKTEFFGKNGQITKQFKTLGSLDPEKRKEFASNLNKIKDDLTLQLEQKNIEIETSQINEKLNQILNFFLGKHYFSFSNLGFLFLRYKSTIFAIAITFWIRFT